MRRRPQFRRLIFAGLALGLVSATRAQLPSKSPFLPAGTAAPATPEAGAPLEFRGYMELGGVLQVRLFDPGKKLARWLVLNERNDEIEAVARQLDRDKGTVTVEHRGAVHTLELRAAKVLSGGPVATAPPPGPPPANVMPAVTQSVALNPSPEQERVRLEAVAAEVARRRALREQAQQTVNQSQGAAPPPGPPPMRQP